MLTNRVGKTILHWTCAGLLSVALSACGGAEEEQSSSSSVTSALVTSSSSSSTNSSTSSSSSSSSIANNAPVISGLAMTTATVGAAYSFQPAATDADGDTLIYSATNVPAWASFNATTHILSGTPTAAGSYSNIVITVSDGKTSVSMAPFAITVSAAVATNRAPVISGSPAAAVVAGSAYTFTPSASDADGDALTYSITNRPTWATFNAATHTLSGTPTAASRGTTTGIVISVSDGRGGVGTLAAFSITVSNRAPTVSGAPSTSVAAASAYNFAPSGADADGDALTWSITNRPSWATFSAATGALTGTPTAAQKGTYSGIVISASDGLGGSAQLASFAITVMNTAPTLTGTPATTGRVGTAYSFAPTSSDANGDTLAYSISNRPSWATFNTATGSLTGSPTAAGTHSGITISVSDGTASASLAAFSIAVSAASTGTASLSWMAPTQNTDGSALTDLAGYTIYFGTSSSSLTSTISVNSAGTTSYTVSGLTVGTTYYFAISAVNTSGVDSGLSSVASKTI